MTKDLKHYMALPYRMEITPIPEDEGGGFSACLPELGRYACVADGDSTEEAVANLLALKEQIFYDYLERGVEIPEPRDQDLENYSGRFVVRLPRELHRDLVRSAEKNGSSLNAYVTTLLAAGKG